MQKISFGGKEYVRATEIAKKFRYTSDYVGQLCRSKKVDARLVGRSWYVEPQSVADYRKTKHKTQKGVARKTSKSVPPTARNRRLPTKQVEPVPRTKTLKVTKQLHKKTTSVVSPVVYSDDESSLVPILNGSEEQPKPKKTNRVRPVVVVENRPAVTVPVVANGSKQTKFVSEKLPEISLSGKLSVTNSDEEKPAAVEMMDEPTSDSLTEELGHNQAKLTEDTVMVETTEAAMEDTEGTKRTAGAATSADFTPDTVTVRRKSQTNLVPLLVSGGVAVGLALLMLGMGSTVSVYQDTTENYLQFSLSNLTKSLVTNFK